MKKTLTTIAALFGAASLLVAGPMVSGKSGKVTVVEPPPAGCECFEGGWALGGYAALFMPEGDLDDEVGGGIIADYFFNRYFGISAYAQWAEINDHGDDSFIHNYGADAVLRFPITSICIAPYLFAGPGVHTNSSTEFIGRFGAGLDIRLWDCNSLFVDWTYTLPGGDGNSDEIDEYQVVRLGLKFRF